MAPLTWTYAEKATLILVQETAKYRRRVKFRPALRFSGDKGRLGREGEYQQRKSIPESIPTRAQVLILPMRP